MTERKTMSLDDLTVTPRFKEKPTSAPKIGAKEAQTKALRESRSIEDFAPPPPRPIEKVAKEAEMVDKPRPAKKAVKEKKMIAKKKAKATPKKAVAKKAAKSARRTKKAVAKTPRVSVRKAVKTVSSASGKDKKIDQLIKLLSGQWRSTLVLEKELGWVNNTLRSTISNLQRPKADGGRGLVIDRMRLEGVTYYSIGVKKD